MMVRLMSRILAAFFAVVTVLFSAVPASASLSFTLNSGSSGQGSGPFGTVKLVQVSSTEVQVTVTLSGGAQFVETGSHQTFDFQIKNDPTISITGVTSGFAVGSTGVTQSGFGDFDYSIDCTACGSGASSPQPGPLVFDVSVSSGTLSINDFIKNSNGWYFSADLFVNGKTGPVGSNVLPEPTSYLVFAVGLLGLIAFRRRYRASRAANNNSAVVDPTAS
jgi:hypothetical protein